MSEKHRILIVEDEPDHLMALEMIFERETDLAISSASNTKEADKVLGDKEVDLILLDIALPGEHGIAFCRRLRAQPKYANLPIIALSAYPDQIYSEKAAAAGCTKFMTKPFEPKKLIETVKGYIKR